MIRLAYTDDQAAEQQTRNEEIRTALLVMLRGLVDRPDEVDISVRATTQMTVFLVHCPNGEYGKLVGKKHRHIEALRFLLLARGGREGHQYILEMNQ